MEFYIQSEENPEECLSILDDNRLMDFTSQDDSDSVTESEFEFVQQNASNSNDKELEEYALMRKLDGCLIKYEPQSYQVFDEENELILQCIKKESLLLNYIYK